MPDRLANLESVLMSNLILTPVLLVWFGGIILCAEAWRKHPVAARLAISGLIVQVFGVAIGITSQLLMRPFHSGDGMATTYGIMMLMGWLRAFTTASGYALLLAAIFADRGKKTAQAPEMGE